MASHSDSAKYEKQCGGYFSMLLAMVSKHNSERLGTTGGCDVLVADMISEF